MNGSRERNMSGDIINGAESGKKLAAILSMQAVNNFGSLIQAYSLKKMVESLGYDVCFMDIEKRPEDDALMRDHRISYLSEMESGSVTKKLSDGYIVNRFRNKGIQNEQDRIFNEFRDRCLPPLSHCGGGRPADAVIIGSDEVFNCIQESPWGFTSQLFGNVENTGRVITYAACCGFTKLTDVPDAVIKKISESFKNISAFSVRDTNTFEFVSGIRGSAGIDYHLDPALLCDFDNEIDEVRIENHLPERYCLVYSYKNRIHEKSEIDYIERFCRENDMEIIAVGMPQKWIKNFYAASPFELLKIFKEAAFVITDTFHGTVFSARFAERFAVIVRESNRNKLGDLTGRLGLEDHVVSDVDVIAGKYDLVHDKTNLKSLLNAEYEKAMAYLRDNLNG
ncbi:MAG: polysaccharide pyruvyl transferase family protein [Clostridiales bacterium]|nr:polysaccharide pyruvyl transferase family protein [Clostridiales bacterium]MBR3248034.1 polysaccharide pyruvyl transferase family protein [Clostridiales bacterium]